jgi:hypothetical protein
MMAGITTIDPRTNRWQANRGYGVSIRNPV